MPNSPSTTDAPATAPIPCQHCGSNNRPGAKFCDQCGFEQVLRCLNCDHELRSAARFCDHCGTAVGVAGTGQNGADKSSRQVPTAAPHSTHHSEAARTAPISYTPKHLADRILSSRSAMEGERKNVTVMFVDLQGSLDLSEQIDPELWHSILDTFFSLLGAEIHRFEGTINQYTGDGVMALFGAPVAHEDHAQRACYAALALQKNLRDFSRSLRLQHELNVSVRIGINSGEVVVGRIGDDLRMDYTAQGHAVGLAARMESLAESGQVYLTEHTEKLVHGFFDLENLGAMSVKGVSEPLEVFVLLGSGELKTRLDRSLERGLTPYVGRDSEQQALQRAWQSVLKGASQVVGVCGDAGLGKSRFCYEFGEQLQTAGVEVYSATAVPYGSAVPNFPIKTLLRSLFAIFDSDTDVQARKKVVGTMVVAGVGSDDCRQLVLEFLNISTGTESVQLPPERRRERLGRVITSLLLGWDAPRLLVIEDLHWLDPASMAFLQDLIERMPATQTLLLLNYRPEFDASAVDRSKSIEMLPLSEDELVDLTAVLLGDGEGMSVVAEHIIRRASGSPFFVEETIHALKGDGWFVGESGGYELTPGALRPVCRVIDEVVPDTVQAILAGRIDALPSLSKTVLQTAAVIGQHFTLAMLSKVSAVAIGELGQIMSSLQQLSFVRPHRDADGEHYDFTHPVTLEVAYQAQLQSRRAQLHAAVAKELEAINSSPGPGSSRLASHWYKAGNLEMAGLRMMQSGQFAAASDMREAASRLRKAILWLSETTKNDVKVGGARAGDGNQNDGSQRAKVLLYRVEAHAALLRISSFVGMGESEVDALYQQAQKIVDDTGDQQAAAGLYISYGSLHVYRGQPDRALDYIGRALTLIRSGGFHDTEAALRLPVLVAYFAAGRVRDGLTALREPDGSCWGDSPITAENYQSRSMRAILLALSGELGRSREEMLACLAESGRQQRSMSWVEAQLVEWAWHSGDTSEVLERAERAVAEAENFGSYFFQANARRALVDAHLLLGQHQQARRSLGSISSEAEGGSPLTAFSGMRLALLAEVAMQAGDLKEALKTARAAVQRSEQQNDRLSLCRAWWVVGMSTQQAGDFSGAEDAWAALEQCASDAGILVFKPRWLEGRALLARQQGDADKASRLLEKARAAYAAMGADGHLSRLAAAS